MLLLSVRYSVIFSDGRYLKCYSRYLLRKLQPWTVRYIVECICFLYNNRCALYNYGTCQYIYSQQKAFALSPLKFCVMTLAKREEKGCEVTDFKFIIKFRLRVIFKINPYIVMFIGIFILELYFNVQSFIDTVGK